MISRQIYLFFSICLIIVSCNNKKGPDLSNINLNIPLERFDQELNNLNADDMLIQTELLHKKYTWFYEDYISQMIGAGIVHDPSYLSNLSEILRNPDYQALSASVEETFANMDRQQAELNDAFKHIRYYYPDQKLPRLITFISGFAVQIPVGNDYIGIGLDMFLGQNGNKFYAALQQSIPQYISRRFTSENITPRVVEAFIREDMFPDKDTDRSLLAKMIYNGKIMYMMDAVMPELPDTLKIGYTTEQLEWCIKNEGGLWAYFIENELLFETDYMKIQKYLAEAPFTPGVGERSESAPKLGIWIGGQIVKKYMDENPDVKLQDLMVEKDAQKILTESKYKPKM